ncbi:MAG TPA: tRNA (adenosine(37)-N6)-dimethylallyltransferase MiaA [Flavisolibacter sp.]|nr:tRNA (adenosine(37)-N6)-dimethylallyltransferase MiaA [Flavisolibacter sp.]
MSSTPSKTVIIIAGPTAVGKTRIAIDVAKHFHTEIISADSRQCYKELNIGVARPSSSELQEVPHHFIASHSIHDKVTAATFEGYALEKASTIFQKKDVVVIVGGTGLYIKALLEGLDEIPAIHENIRRAIDDEYKLKNLEWLQKEVERVDPKYFQKGETQNPRRLIRALEVFRTTGKSIVDFQKRSPVTRPFKIIKIALSLPKPLLHENINKRVEQMIEDGLVDEVKSLISYKHLPALQTVGYKEVFEHLEGNATLNIAIENIKKNTRQYAKRQITWFKKDLEFQWFIPDSEAVIEYINSLDLKPNG